MNIPSTGIGALRIFRWLLLVAALAGAVPGSAMAGTISASEKNAWSENAGWINFRPQYGGVSVYFNYLSGYAWHENLGWLKLGSDAGGPYSNSTATDWGVNRDEAGNLSGYAWCEGCGWVKFNPVGGGVKIDPATGAFSGMAWGENVGWISFRSQPEAAVTYGVGLIPYILSFVFNGTGGGTVTAPSFSCNSNCAKTFFDAAVLSLTAEARQYSILDGWAGCDFAIGTYCELTLNGDATVTVTFDEDTVHTVRIDGPTPVYYPTLQQAYDQAGPNDTIQAWGINLAESIVCGNSTQVKITGGYDQQYQHQTGATAVSGLTVAKGAVIVDQIVIR